MLVGNFPRVGVRQQQATFKTVSSYAEKLALGRERARRYREKFPERKKAANDRYYERHTETCKRAVRVWNKRNLKVRALQARARKKGIPVPTKAEVIAQGIRENE